MIFNFVGSSGGGIYRYNISNFTLNAAGTNVTLKWSDPEDSAWQGTYIVRKSGSYPENEEDGVLVVDSKTKNQYSETGLTDSGLTGGVTYYYQAFPYSDDGVCNNAINRAEAITVQSLPAKDTLENMSWGDISRIASLGLASSYWQIGDSKTINLTSAALGNTSITVQIVAFNHDDLADGSGKAPITFCMNEAFTTKRRPSNLKNPYWSNSSLRTTDLQTTVFNALPSDVSGVIKHVNKLTAAGSGSSTITTTSDTLFLASAIEITGSTEISYAGEGTQYEGFASGIVSKSIPKPSSAGSFGNYYYWTRSPSKNYDEESYEYNRLCTITSTGALSDEYYSRDHYIRAFFCI